MRVPGRLILFGVVALVVVGVADGQFGGGFGFGKKGADYFALANNPQVRGELKITDAQADKLPAAALKAVSEVLDDGQLKRLKQIYLQTRGNTVYLEADVKKELKITDEQVKKIQAALDTQVREQKEIQGFDLERTQEILKTATDAVKGVLTADQKTAWTKMIGDPFELQQFGGKGFKK